MGVLRVVTRGAGAHSPIIVYLDVGDSNSRTRNLSINGVPLPASVTAAADFDLKSTIWTLAATYGVADRGEATFDLLVGARLAHMKEELKWTFTGNFGPITPPTNHGQCRRIRRSVGRDHRW